MPEKWTNEQELQRAAQNLVLQAYSAKRYGTHGPTRMQWLELGSALAVIGVRLPEDWASVIGEIPVEVKS